MSGPAFATKTRPGFGTHRGDAQTWGLMVVFLASLFVEIYIGGLAHQLQANNSMQQHPYYNLHLYGSDSISNSPMLSALQGWKKVAYLDSSAVERSLMAEGPKW